MCVHGKRDQAYGDTRAMLSYMCCKLKMESIQEAHDYSTRSYCVLFSMYWSVVVYEAHHLRALHCTHGECVYVAETKNSVL